MTLFYNIIKTAINDNIPITDIKNKCTPLPWWDEECKNTIKTLNEVRRQFKVDGLMSSFKNITAQTKRQLRTKEKNYLKLFANL